MKIPEMHPSFACRANYGLMHLWDWRTGEWTPPLVPEKRYYVHNQSPCELHEDVYVLRKDGGYGENERLFSGSRSWDSELVLAMTRPTRTERWRAFWRGHSSRKLYNNPHGVEQAVLIAATACERCYNTLCWTYGLCSGYAEFSEEWQQSKTSCQFCDDRE